MEEVNNTSLNNEPLDSIQAYNLNQMHRSIKFKPLQSIKDPKDVHQKLAFKLSSNTSVEARPTLEKERILNGGTKNKPNPENKLIFKPIFVLPKVKSTSISVHSTQIRQTFDFSMGATEKFVTMDSKVMSSMVPENGSRSKSKDAAYKSERFTDTVKGNSQRFEHSNDAMKELGKTEGDVSLKKNKSGLKGILKNSTLTSKFSRGISQVSGSISSSPRRVAFNRYMLVHRYIKEEKEDTKNRSNEQHDLKRALTARRFNYV